MSEYKFKELQERYDQIAESNFKDQSKQKGTSGFFKLLLYYFQPYIWAWAGFITFTLVIAGITVAIPKLTNIIFTELSNSIFGNKMPLSNQVLIYWAIGFGAAFFLSGVMRFFQRWVGGYIAQLIQIDLRVRILNKLLDFDIAYYRDKKKGELLTKLISDTQIIGQQIFQIPTQFFNSIFVFFGSVAILFTLQNKVVQPDGQTISYASTEIKLAAIVIGSAFLLTASTAGAFSILRRKWYQQRKVVSAINGDVNDRINSIRLIKTMGTVEYEKERFKQVHKSYYKASMRTVRTQSLIMAVVFTGLTSLNIISLLVGIIYVNQGKLNPTVMIGFTTAVNSLIFPIAQFVMLLGGLATASSSAWRINEILVQERTIDPHKDGMAIPEAIKNITFKNVTFGYEPNELILNRFNFTFQNNHSYALVGESGVGKTTISNLFLRLYDPVDGQIMINGKYDLKKLNLKSYLDQIGYVEQEPEILFGDFYENIAYGSDVDDQKLIEIAAKKANLYDFINSLPKKFNTLIGEHGFILSGGQKQRLVIARMFLRNPKVLILDEATSSLDNIIEKEIQAELNLLMKGRTTVIIAHRLTTIKNVDSILVLQRDVGVVQTGKFDSLKDQPGRFKQLYDAGLMK